MRQCIVNAAQTLYTKYLLRYHTLTRKQATEGMITITVLGKKRVLRKNLSDMAMMNVPMKRRQENIKTSATCVAASQSLPNIVPFNAVHSLGLSVAQSTSSEDSVLFTVLLPENTSTFHSVLLLVSFNITLDTLQASIFQSVTWQVQNICKQNVLQSKYDSRHL